MNNDNLKYYKITLKETKENDKKRIINKFGFKSLSRNYNNSKNQQNRKKSNSTVVSKTTNKIKNKNNLFQSQDFPFLENNKKLNQNPKNYKNSQSCSVLTLNDKKNNKSRNYSVNSTGNLFSNNFNKKFSNSYSQQKKSHGLISTNVHTQSNENIFPVSQKIKQKIKQVIFQPTNKQLNEEKKIIFNRLFTINKNKNNSNAFNQKNIFNNLLLQPKPIIKKGDCNNKVIFNKFFKKVNNQQNNLHNKKTISNQININSNNFKNLNNKNDIKHTNNNLENIEDIIPYSNFVDIPNYIPPEKEYSTLIVTNEKSSETIKENCFNINKIIDITKRKQIKKIHNRTRKKFCQIILCNNNKKNNNNNLNHSFTNEDMNCNISDEDSIIKNNIISHEPCHKKILSNDDSSFMNVMHLCGKEEGFDDDTDELNDLENEAIINNRRFIPNTAKKKNKKLYSFFSRGYSYNLSSTVIRSNERVKEPYDEKNYGFIEEINNNNDNIPILNFKKFMKLKSICVYKIICFIPEIYPILINIDKYIKMKIIHSFDVLFTPIINNFQNTYSFLQLINYQIVSSNIIYHNKKFFILNLLILCKIISKETELSYEVSCNYLSNNKIFDYLWKIDLQNKKDISIWINTELNHCKNNVKNFSFTSQVSSFTYGDEIKLFLNISNLSPSSIEWFQPINSVIKPGFYEKKKLINKVKYDPLRACEIENQILLWHNFEVDKHVLFIDDFKDLFEEFFSIEGIFYDISKYSFYKIKMIAKNLGLLPKNKYCSFDIKIVESDSSIQNEIQCIYFMNSNFYCSTMEIRIGTEVCFYITDMK